MYTRGQFAVIGNVGRKALRLYEEAGILVPACVNEENGYHYYTSQQLVDLEKIKAYRKIGLSLMEIRQVLEGKLNEEEAIKGRLQELDDQTRSIRETVRTMTQAKKEEDGKSAEIDIVPFHRKECISIQENVERENLGISVGKLYERAARENLVPEGAHFVKYTGLMEEEGNFTMTTYLPVSSTGGTLAGKGMQAYERCLHLCFKKGFSRVKEAHIELQNYAQEHEIRCIGTVLEVYNKDWTVDVYMVTE
mgnify:CR=1 FL=1